MNQTESQYMYQQLGISEEVWRYGQKTEESLKERFRDFDETAEYTWSVFRYTGVRGNTTHPYINVWKFLNGQPESAWNLGHV